MAYEVLTAFFLEAGFLGVMLFGMQKVGKRLHFFATLMVAIGTFISAFWILSVNSWMQTPTGYAMNADGQFVPAAGWAAIIFNPSFPYRLVHTVIAAYLTTALAVGAVGAWHLLKDSTKARNTRARCSPWPCGWPRWWRRCRSSSATCTASTRSSTSPPKVMAMEGHYQSHPDGAPLILFGIPNDEEQRMEHAIEIPRLSSLILKHDLDAPLERARHRRAGESSARGSRVLDVPRHGGPGLPHVVARRLQPARARHAQALRLALAACASRSSWGRRDSSP